MQDLDVLVPPSRHVRVGGREIEVKVLVWRQIPPFLRAVSDVLPQLLAGDYLAVAMGHPEALTTALTVATGTDRGFIDGLRPDEIVALAQAVLEINAGFFAERVIPMGLAAAAGLKAAMSSPPSTGSSAGDTGSTSSSGSPRIN